MVCMNSVGPGTWVRLGVNVMVGVGVGVSVLVGVGVSVYPKVWMRMALAVAWKPTVPSTSAVRVRRS